MDREPLAVALAALLPQSLAAMDWCLAQLAGSANTDGSAWPDIASIMRYHDARMIGDPRTTWGLLDGKLKFRPLMIPDSFTEQAGIPPTYFGFIWTWRWPYPAHRLRTSESPALRAAARKGVVRWCTCGYAAGAVAVCSAG